jgi:energy-coupling factor transport system permease protein
VATALRRSLLTALVRPPLAAPVRITGPARLLHPGAWWIWAASLAYAAMRTTDPVLLVEIAAVSASVVAARRGNAPWARAYGLLLRFGILTIVVTILLQILIGVRLPGHVLVRLPSVALPSWAAGLSLGGPVTAEAVLNAGVTGLRLAVLLACFGAANALAHPARLVRILPAALYEVGVAVVVAMTFVPQLAESVVRVRAAQRMRGRSAAGLSGLRGVAVPVLEEALDRAIALAASMDSRGYGRRAALSAGSRRLGGAGLLVGLGAAVVGTYQVIGGGGRLGPALLVGGTGLAVAAGLTAGRRVRRSRYRPDPWAVPEWLTAGCGLAVAITFQVLVHDPLGAGVPLSWPTVPLLPFASVLLALAPVLLTPPLPDGSR